MRNLLIVGLISVCMVAPAVASDTGYHDVYEPDGDSWAISKQKYAELYGQGSEEQQYRWFSDASATVCQPPYYAPVPGPPDKKLITDEAVLYPWIEIHLREKDIHWDLFKPYTFMGKTFQLWLQANTPIQILFGCGEMMVPVAFDTVANEIQWGLHRESRCFTDKIRVKSILGKDPPNPGTPPDEIAEYLWWYEFIPPRPGDEPDPHRITPEELAILPPWPHADWRRAETLNGMVWIYDDTVELHEGWWTQFFEVLDVEECDSEGKYKKEIVLTIAPDP
jgi:hypothetical protein